MTIERASVGRGLWLKWILASAVAAAVGGVVFRAVSMAVGGVISEAAGRVVGEAVVGAFALGGVVGGMGIAQWLLLRQQVSWANWWVLASAVGGALGGAVGLGTYGALTVFGSEALGGVVGGIVGLGVFGLTQWLVLRRQVSWANWWVLASVVSLALAALLTGVVFWAVGDKGGGEVGNGVVYGAIYGAITGGALVWLLRWPVPDAEADEAKV